MTKKTGKLPYTLVTLASICLVSGILVLTGGESDHGKNGEVNISIRKHA